jgi:rubredoxin
MTFKQDGDKRGSNDLRLLPDSPQDLPKDWQCPICGADKRTFENRAREIAGFEENQGYGFGTNTMTSGQKSLLIYGSLVLFFALFCAGYLLQ